MWFVRMARWVRRPPSRTTILIWLTVIGLAVVIGGSEWLFGWEFGTDGVSPRRGIRPTVTFEDAPEP
ncbi:MAG: hypothetical protein AAFO58_02305 [Pseudomonadota bacterium]